MGIPEYIVIFAVLLIGLAANIFLVRWILRINVIVGRLNEIVRLMGGKEKEDKEQLLTRIRWWVWRTRNKRKRL